MTLTRMWFLNLAAFIAGAVIVSVILSRAIPSVRPPQISAKLDWLAQHGEEYDTFFIGSSRVQRQIIPAIFDSEMAVYGISTKSFNLSADGMRTPEDEFVMGCAFASRTVPVRLLVIECNAVKSRVDDAAEGTAREVYWHDNARMARLWRHLWAGDLSPNLTVGDSVGIWWKRFIEFPAHVRHWVWNVTRLGLGSDMLTRQILGYTPPDPSIEIGENGFRRPACTPMSDSVLRAYEKDLAAARKEPPCPKEEDAESQSALAWKKGCADRLGAHLVLVASPFPTKSVFAPKDRNGITFLDYSDPNRYPDLYVPENRRDRGHLNVRGAEIYTRIVARQIAEMLRPGS